jgi:O-acetyl-ADP-ribose deacetylase (regulator of RNase III)
MLVNGGLMRKYILFFLLLSPIFSLFSEEFQIHATKVYLCKDDITQMPVDAIVNAANKKLPWPAGGVCKAIYEAADHKKLNEWVKNNIKSNANGNRIELGKAIATPSFNLAAHGVKFIIHTVGPDARTGENESAIYDAYCNSLLLANQLQLTSIAFPAISIGIFKCDKKEVAHYAMKALQEILPKTNIQKVYLTILDSEYYEYCKQFLMNQ